MPFAVRDGCERMVASAKQHCRLTHGSVLLKAVNAKGLFKTLWKAGAAGFISITASTPPGASTLPRE
jgi:hypothetical protein